MSNINPLKPAISGVSYVETDFNSWCLCDDGPHDGYEDWALLTPDQQINLKVGEVVAVWDFGGDSGVLATITAKRGRYADVRHDPEGWMRSGEFTSLTLRNGEGDI